MMISLLDRMESTAGKDAGYQHLVLFSTVLSKALFSRIVKRQDCVLKTLKQTCSESISCSICQPAQCTRPDMGLTYSLYSITCIQRTLKGSTKSGLLQQVVIKCRFY